MNANRPDLKKITPADRKKPAFSPYSSITDSAPSYIYNPLFRRLFPIIYALQSYRVGRPALISIVNPDLPESKTAILSSISPRQQKFVPSFIKYEFTGQAETEEIDKINQALAEAGLHFPLVAKPDHGCKGIMVSLLPDGSALLSYLRAIHEPTAIQFQELVDMPYEAGVLYLRHPEKENGRIVSLTLKTAPCVVGDGTSTIRELIQRSGANRKMRASWLRKNGAHLDEIPGKDEYRVVSFTRNLDQGGIYIDLTDEITPELTEVIDQISLDIPNFYYGRFDVKCQSLDELLLGKSFKILEINDMYSEDGRLYSCNTELLSRVKRQLALQKEILQIAAANRDRGHRMKSPLFFLKQGSETRKFIKKGDTFRV